MSRPVSRVRLLHCDVGGRVREATDLVVRALADDLAHLGVQTRQQLASGADESGWRADVAVWLPDDGGQTPVPDPKRAPARVHVAVVVDPNSSPRALVRYDALVVPADRLAPAVRETAAKASRPVVVVPQRLGGRGPAKDVERAAHGLADRRVVVVDVRAGTALGADLERTVVQLALASHGASVVLVTAGDDATQRRLRELCTRHAVDAWLAVGDEGLVGAIAAADYVVATPAWDELVWAALCRTPLGLARSASGTTTPLGAALRDASLVDDVPGALQLAATLDRRLADIDALVARGTAFGDALVGPARGLVDALAAVEPVPVAHGPTSRWEPIGPHAERRAAPAPPGTGPTPSGTTATSPATTTATATATTATTTTTTATATTPTTPTTPSTTPTAPPPSPAQKIEDELAALKAKLALGGGHKPGSGL
jgi:hypothetical protein